MAITKFDLRQSVLRSALSMVGSAVNDTADSLFPKIDAQIAKLFEDRNVLLTDGGTITFTGTQIQFTENLNIVLNSKISGASPQVISLGSSNVSLSATGQIWYAVIDRSAGTASTSVATSLPAVTSSNQEVFLIAKRVDAGDGTQRIYWRNGMAMNAGQSVRLGASGSGSGGSGVGDDLDALLFRASFTDLFAENATNSNSGVNSTGTNATYNAAKTMYTVSYDASRTMTTSGTSATLSGAPAFTVAAGDVVYNTSSGEVRKIASISSQTSYTLESAFSSNLSSQAVCVSQAVHTKDIYNLSVDGAALSAAFGSATFSEILVDYKDNATSGSNLFTPNVAPVVGFVASPDNSSWTTVKVRPTNETDTASSVTLSSAGTSLYLRFFANKSSGSGTVNVIAYKAFMQKSDIASSGGVTNSAYAFLNGVGTPINCSTSVVGGKSTITLTWSYAMGVLSGTTAAGIEVWVNGQKIPRYVNSTLTPDASFTEVSPTIIQLDRDYSSQNVSVEVFQRTQIVDSSTTNTTSISNIQNNYLVTPPVISSLTSGSGTFNLSYVFYTPACNASAGATYTHNGVTYTVTQTASGATQLVASGSSAPLSTGTLTKASGTGDASIAFTAYKSPLWLRVRAVGGGGGGGTGGTTGGGSPTAGGNTTFGLHTANGGAIGNTSAGAGVSGGAGGSATIGTGGVGFTITGGSGVGCAGSVTAFKAIGGAGGQSVFGGAGVQGAQNSVATAAIANTGAGGAGGATDGTNGAYPGSGGGAGGYFEVIITSPASTYSYAVGAGGSGGSSGTGGWGGSAGGSGLIIVEQHYIGG